MADIEIGIDGSAAQRGAQQYEQAVKAIVDGIRQLAASVSQLDAGFQKANSVLVDSRGNAISAAAAIDTAGKQAKGAGADAAAGAAGVSLLEKRLSKLSRTASFAIGPLSGVGARLRALSSIIKSFGVGGAVLGAGALGTVLSIGAAVREFAPFEKTLAQLSALTGFAGEALRELGDEALRLGRATTFTAGQVAEGFRIVGSQRPELLKNRDALVEVTKQALILAEAGSIALPDAAKALTVSLNQFSATTADAGKFVDILAEGARLGAATIPELATAITKAGATAKNTGLTFAETAAALEVLAASGLSAEEFGTGFRNILLRLQKAGGDLNPEMSSLGNVLELLAKKGLQPLEFFELFGARQVNLAHILIESRAAYLALVEALSQSEGAGLLASQRATDNLIDDFAKLRSEISALAITIGREFAPQVRTFINGLRTIFSALNNYFDKNGEAKRRVVIDLETAKAFSGEGIGGAQDPIKLVEARIRGIQKRISELTLGDNPLAALGGPSVTEGGERSREIDVLRKELDGLRAAYQVLLDGGTLDEVKLAFKQIGIEAEEASPLLSKFTEEVRNVEFQLDAFNKGGVEGFQRAVATLKASKIAASIPTTPALRDLAIDTVQNLPGVKGVLQVDENNLEEALILAELAAQKLNLSLRDVQRRVKEALSAPQRASDFVASLQEKTESVKRQTAALNVNTAEQKTQLAVEEARAKLLKITKGALDDAQKAALREYETALRRHDLRYEEVKLERERIAQAKKATENGLEALEAGRAELLQLRARIENVRVDKDEQALLNQIYDFRFKLLEKVTPAQRAEANAIADSATALLIKLDAEDRVAKAERDRLDELDRAQKRAAKQRAEALQEPFRNAARGIQDAFSDTFRKVFDDGIDSFKDFGNTVLDLLKDFAAEYLTLLIFRPLIESVATGDIGKSLFGDLLGTTEDTTAQEIQKQTVTINQNDLAKLNLLANIAASLGSIETKGIAVDPTATGVVDKTVSGEAATSAEGLVNLESVLSDLLTSQGDATSAQFQEQAAALISSLEVLQEQSASQEGLLEGIQSNTVPAVANESVNDALEKVTATQSTLASLLGVDETTASATDQREAQIQLLKQLVFLDEIRNELLETISGGTPTSTTSAVEATVRAVDEANEKKTASLWDQLRGLFQASQNETAEKVVDQTVVVDQVRKQSEVQTRVLEQIEANTAASAGSGGAAAASAGLPEGFGVGIGREVFSNFNLGSIFSTAPTSQTTADKAQTDAAVEVINQTGILEGILGANTEQSGLLSGVFDLFGNLLGSFGGGSGILGIVGNIFGLGGQGGGVTGLLGNLLGGSGGGGGLFGLFGGGAGGGGGTGAGAGAGALGGSTGAVGLAGGFIGPAIGGGLLLSSGIKNNDPISTGAGAGALGGLAAAGILGYTTFLGQLGATLGPIGALVGAIIGLIVGLIVSFASKSPRRYAAQFLTSSDQFDPRFVAAPSVEGPFGFVGLQSKRKVDARSLINTAVEFDSKFVQFLNKRQIELVTGALQTVEPLRITPKRFDIKDTARLLYDRALTIIEAAISGVELPTDQTPEEIRRQVLPDFIAKKQDKRPDFVLKEVERFFGIFNPLRDGLEELSGKYIPNARQEIDRLNNLFVELLPNALELGITFADLSAELEKGQQALRDKFVRELDLEILGIVDPFNSAVVEIIDRENELLQEALAFGVGMESVTQLIRVQREELLRQTLAPVQEVLDTISLDAASPTQTLEILSQRFQEALLTNDAQSVARAATELLDVQERTFGRSDVFFAQEDLVRQALEGFSARLTDQVLNTANAIASQTTVLAGNQEEQTQVLLRMNESLLQLVAENASLREELSLAAARNA